MNVVTGYKVFHSKQPFHVKYNNGVLPELKIAYETWGELNEAKDNAVLISTGLSANSHARSQPVSNYAFDCTMGVLLYYECFLQL